MAESKELHQIVERAVAQVLDRQLPKLQAELVERVLAELPAAAAARQMQARGAWQAGLKAIWFRPSPAFTPALRKKKFCARCSMPAARTVRASRCSW